MPELPEVEAARSLAEKHCTGLKILKAIVADDDKVIDGIAPRDLEEALEGRTIAEACRKGKQLWLDLGQDSPALMLHFGMTGCLVVQKMRATIPVQGVDAVKYVNAKAVDKDVWPPKYCKIELELSEGRKVAFCDSRRFARARFQEDPLNNPPVSLLGFDILNDRPTVEQLSAVLAKRKSAVKSVIMDQAVLAGVGNWVADEVLHEAKLHPSEKASDLTEAQITALQQALLQVAQTSVAVDADSSQFPPHWLFAHRWKPKTAPNTYKFMTIGGRTTCFEPAVQKLTTPPAEDAETDKDEGEKKPKKKPPAKAKKAAAGQSAAERSSNGGGDGKADGKAGGKGRKKRAQPAPSGNDASATEDVAAADAEAKPAKKKATEARGKKQA